MSEKLIVLAAAIQAKAATTAHNDALDHLAKAADCFDQAGLRQEADFVSSMIEKLATNGSLEGQVQNSLQNQYRQEIDRLLNQALRRNTRLITGQSPEEVGGPKAIISRIDYLGIRGGPSVVTVHGTIEGGAGIEPSKFEDIISKAGNEVRQQMRGYNVDVRWGNIKSNQIPQLSRRGPAMQQPQYEVEIGPATIINDCDDENDARGKKKPTPKERESFRFYGFLSDKDYIEDEDAAWEDE